MTRFLIPSFNHLRHHSLSFLLLLPSFLLAPPSFALLSSPSANHQQACLDAGAVDALERVKQDGNEKAKAQAEEALDALRTPEESAKANTAVLQTTKDDRVREQACLAIYNIADSEEGKAMCVRAGAPAAIISVLKATNDGEVMLEGADALKNIAWSDSESRPAF